MDASHSHCEQGECKPGGSCEGLKPVSGAVNRVDARCVSFAISPWSFGIHLSVTIRKPLRLFTCKRKAVALALFETEFHGG